MSTWNYCYFYSHSLQSGLFYRETRDDRRILPICCSLHSSTKFHWHFLGNFFFFFFFFLGHYSADRGTSRDVSEVNIELVSAMLRWQKGVDGAECLCLQRACICLPEPNLAQFAHTEMKSRHISPPPLPPRRSICFYKWPQTSVARVRAALTDGDGRATCGHVRPRFFFFGVAAGGVLRDVLLRDALTFPLLLKGQLAFG